jgi:hypothetical protein
MVPSVIYYRDIHNKQMHFRGGGGGSHALGGGTAHAKHPTAGNQWQRDSRLPLLRLTGGVSLASQKSRTFTPRVKHACEGPHILPKRRFGKCGFSIGFSMANGPNRRLTPLKSASNIRISSFVLLPKSRVNFTPPKRIFGKDEQKTKCGCSKHFSRS